MNQIRSSDSVLGEYVRCEYRWTSKPCPHCEALNDIAARYCIECRGEIVDPNDQLRANFKAMKRDPTQRQTDEVVRMDCKPGISTKGNKTIRIEWVTPYRQFTTWVQPEATNSRGIQDYQAWKAITDGGAVPPRSVTYQKDATSGFFRIHRYNAEPDHAPE